MLLEFGKSNSGSNRITIAHMAIVQASQPVVDFRFARLIGQIGESCVQSSAHSEYWGSGEAKTMSSLSLSLPDK